MDALESPVAATISGIVFPRSRRIDFICATTSPVAFGFRPNLVPVAFALAIPSICRSRRMSFSNSAIRARMPSNSLPERVAVSASASFGALKPSPFAARLLRMACLSCQNGIGVSSGPGTVNLMYELPVVTIEASQKAATGVHLQDLASYIDKRRTVATKRDATSFTVGDECYHPCDLQPVSAAVLPRFCRRAAARESRKIAERGSLCGEIMS